MKNNAIATDYDIGPPPCTGCEFYSDCAANLKACHLYYNYVYARPGKPRQIRAKAVYSAIDAPDGERDLRTFFEAIAAARESSHVGIFYQPDIKRMTYAEKGCRRYKDLKTNAASYLIGFFGPEFSEQEIAEFIEKRLEQWQR